MFHKERGWKNEENSPQDGHFEIFSQKTLFLYRRTENFIKFSIIKINAPTNFRPYDCKCLRKYVRNW